MQDINIFCVVLFFLVRFSTAAEPNFSIFKMNKLMQLNGFHLPGVVFYYTSTRTFFDINDSIILLIVNNSFRIGFDLLLKYLNAYKLPIYTMIGSKKMAPNQIKI